jgi:hypothetical protein
MKYLLWLAYFSCSVTLAYAQYTPNPVIGGFVVHCTDASGALVFSGEAAISDSAMSTILSNGMRVIQFSHSFRSEPPLLQLFTFAHECGHHLSGDVIAAVVYHHDDWGREMTADRIGIRLVRDQLHITLSQAQWLANYFVNNPAIPPYYLPGPQRAMWIVDCYKTNEDSCGHSTADYSRTSDSASANVGGTGSFCSSLNRVIANADHHFRDIKGTKCALGVCDSTLILPGADHCTVEGHDFFCRMGTAADADDLRTQIRGCLSPQNWTQGDNGNFSNDDLDVDVTERHSHVNVIIRKH